MIKRLVVKGLNHRADGTHDLEFHPDLNVFTGPNGSGKTTLLKLIWYLISGNLERIFAEIPFQSVSIETDVFSLEMAWTTSAKVKLTCQFAGEEESSETLSVDEATRELEQREETVKLLTLSGIMAWKTESSLFFPTFRRIEGGFSRGFKYSTSIRRMPSRATERLQEAMSGLSEEVSVANHKFVASISTDDLGVLLTQKYADIYEEIIGLQSRVLTEISKKIETSAGKADASETQMPQYVTSVVNAIKQVDEQRDLLRKPFSVLSDLTRQLLQHPAIRVRGRVASGEMTDGITLGAEKDGITLGEAKEAISSDKLSAGEKQMLSFLCYNAFSDNAAIFIDEPELSLHVDWQRLLLPVLRQQQTGNQFFVATHSPFIYSRYPDKEFLLGDDRGGEI